VGSLPGWPVVRPNAELDPSATGYIIDLASFNADPSAFTAMLGKITKSAPAWNLRAIERNGLTDEAFADGNYAASVATRAQKLTTTGDSNRPLILVAPQRLAPEIAGWAAALRLERRAYVVRSAIEIAAAESRCVAGDPPVCVRTSEARDSEG